MQNWALQAIAEDGTVTIFGPFTSERAATAAQKIVEKYTVSDTQVILMTKYRREDFSIYS